MTDNTRVEDTTAEKLALEIAKLFDDGFTTPTFGQIETIELLIHQELQKAREDVIVSIFSGDTIEYKGKLFKVSDRDALSFIEWRHSEQDQEVSK